MENKNDLQITTTVLITYASGMLRPEVAEQVEQELDKNEILRLQYEGIINLMQNHPDEDPEELLEQMAARSLESIRQVKETKQQKKSFPRTWLLAAAVILVVVITGSLILYRNNNPASEMAMRMIQDKTISPYGNTTRGIVQTTDTATWKAAFTKSDFQSVVTLLKNKPSKSAEEEFFLALSYLKHSPPQPGKAEPIFSKIAKQETEFTSDAWLYSGLTQTLLNQKKQAITSLQHVVQTAQVKELEDRLRK